MTEIDWSRLKASEIKALAQRNAVVIVPIGATEQHGPHLPSMVDWRCVHEVSHRAALLMEKSTPVVVAPTIPYACPSITCRSTAPSRSTTRRCMP